GADPILSGHRDLHAAVGRESAARHVHRGGRRRRVQGEQELAPAGRVLRRPSGVSRTGAVLTRRSSRRLAGRTGGGCLHGGTGEEQERRTDDRGQYWRRHLSHELSLPPIGILTASGYRVNAGRAPFAGTLHGRAGGPVGTRAELAAEEGGQS